jgi:hypothetical protein
LKRRARVEKLNGRIILKCNFISVWACGLDSSGLVWGPVSGSGEHSNEPMGSWRAGKFLGSWTNASSSKRTLLHEVSVICVKIHVSVYALAQLYNVSGDISGIARQGSGSACRSLYGGFVRWHQGSALDGSDSIATQVVPESHWPEMRILVLVVKQKCLLTPVHACARFFFFAHCLECAQKLQN